MIREFTSLALIMVLQAPFMASAGGLTCEASRTQTTGDSREVETKKISLASGANGLTSGSLEIKECYFSVRGRADGSDLTLYIVTGEPPQSGAGVVTAGAVSEGKDLRLSYVQGWNVCKLACRR